MPDRADDWTDRTSASIQPRPTPLPLPKRALFGFPIIDVETLPGAPPMIVLGPGLLDEFVVAAVDDHADA